MKVTRLHVEIMLKAAEECLPPDNLLRIGLAETARDFTPANEAALGMVISMAPQDWEAVGARALVKLRQGVLRQGRPVGRA